MERKALSRLAEAGSKIKAYHHELNDLLWRHSLDAILEVDNRLPEAIDNSLSLASNTLSLQVRSLCLCVNRKASVKQKTQSLSLIILPCLLFAFVQYGLPSIQKSAAEYLASGT